MNNGLTRAMTRNSSVQIIHFLTQIWLADRWRSTNGRTRAMTRKPSVHIIHFLTQIWLADRWTLLNSTPVKYNQIRQIQSDTANTANTVKLNTVEYSQIQQIQSNTANTLCHKIRVTRLTRADRVQWMEPRFRLDWFHSVTESSEWSHDHALQLP